MGQARRRVWLDIGAATSTRRLAGLAGRLVAPPVSLPAWSAPLQPFPDLGLGHESSATWWAAG